MDGLNIDVLLRFEDLGETEVANLDLVAINKDIRRLEVVVDNLFILQIGECRGNLLDPAHYLSLRKDLS